MVPGTVNRRLRYQVPAVSSGGGVPRPRLKWRQGTTLLLIFWPAKVGRGYFHIPRYLVPYRVGGSAYRGLEPRRASRRIGSKSSMGLPEGPSTRVCLPPTPVTNSLRKRTPALRSLATVAARSGTSNPEPFPPPGPRS